MTNKRTGNNKSNDNGKKRQQIPFGDDSKKGNYPSGRI
jgi:hypothetical protein